jgi:hypothetical protein
MTKETPPNSQGVSKKKPFRAERRMFLATKALRRNVFALGGNNYVKTIIRSFARSGVHLRNPQRAESAAH